MLADRLAPALSIRGDYDIDDTPQGAARYPKTMGGRARKLSIIADWANSRKPGRIMK
ncbi:hypothetical protein [Achromobacter arsenitoxydans]|uniref:hypothetical protein n=1 Tax=Achromobacter arsenitoxydans TaxID=1147684 RepID=UPI001427B585|nr:hypothetical protein [Achromobacter arsenitoxydans]